MSQLAQGEVQCLNSSGEGETTHWKDSSSHSVDKSFVEPLALQQATRISQSSLVYPNTSMSAEQTVTCSQSANCSVLSPDQKLSRSFSNRLLQHSNSFSDDIFASLSTALSTVPAVADNNADANSTSHSVTHQDNNSSFINNCSSSSFREKNYQPSVAPDLGSAYEKNSFESGIADVVTDQLGLSSEAPSFESGISMQSGDALSRHYHQTYGTHLDKNSVDNSVLQPDQKYSQSPHFIQREFIENQNVFGSTPINSRVQSVPPTPPQSSKNNPSCVLKNSLSNTMPSSIAVTPKPALRRRSRSENRASYSNLPEEGTPQRRRNTAESIFRSSRQENSLQSRGSSGQINTSFNHPSHSSLPRQASRCNSRSQIHNSRSQIHDSPSQIHNSPSQIHNSPSKIHNSRSQVHDSPNHQIYDSSLHYGHGSPALARSTESTVTLRSTLDSSVGRRSSSNLMDGGPPPHVARVIRTASYPRDLLTPQRLKWVCSSLFTPKRLEFVRLLVNVGFSIPLLIWKKCFFQN